MRVAMRHYNLAVEIYRLAEKRVQKSRVTLVSGRVALVDGFGFGEIKARIGLHDDHQTRRIFSLSLFK